MYISRQYLISNKMKRDFKALKQHAKRLTKFKKKQLVTRGNVTRLVAYKIKHSYLDT